MAVLPSDFSIRVPRVPQKQWFCLTSSSLSQCLDICLDEIVGKGCRGHVYGCFETSCQQKTNCNLVVKVMSLNQNILQPQNGEEEFPDEFVSTEAFEQECQVSLQMGKHNIGPQVYAFGMISFESGDPRIAKIQFKQMIVPQKLMLGFIVMDKLQYTLADYQNKIESLAPNLRESYLNLVKSKILQNSIKAVKLGVLHLDLNCPDNIMLNVDQHMRPQRIYLIDWGLSCPTEGLEQSYIQKYLPE